MVSLTPAQYNELLKAQEQLQTAQANIQKVATLLGLAMDKPYTVSVQMEELKLESPPIPDA